MGDAGDSSLAHWLRTEMSTRGFPHEGPRAGGAARLADESGISRASISRILAGGDPSYDNLRTLARFFEVPLNVVLVRAGWATPEELSTTPFADDPDQGGPVESSTPESPPEIHAVPAIQLGREGDPDPQEALGELEPHEWRIWAETAVPWPARLAAIRGMREAEADVDGRPGRAYRRGA